MQKSCDIKKYVKPSNNENGINTSIRGGMMYHAERFNIIPFYSERINNDLYILMLKRWSIIK